MRGIREWLGGGVAVAAIIALLASHAQTQQSTLYYPSGIQVSVGSTAVTISPPGVVPDGTNSVSIGRPAPWAISGQPHPDPTQALSAEDLVTLRQAVRATANGVSLDERELTFTGADAVTEISVEIPGIWVQDEGTLLLGTPNDVQRLNFTGAGVTATRVSDTAVITIPGGGGGGQAGATAEQVAQIEELEEFEAALRTTVEVSAEQTLTQATSNAFFRLPGSLNVQTADAELLVVVGSNSAHTVDVADLLGKATAGNGDQASSANAVRWTVGGNTFSLGRQADGRFLFAAGDIGSYAVTISEDYINATGLRRRLSNRPRSAGCNQRNDSRGPAGPGKRHHQRLVEED